MHQSEEKEEKKQKKTLGMFNMNNPLAISLLLLGQPNVSRKNRLFHCTHSTPHLILVSKNR